jgi:hypothetical protein
MRYKDNQGRNADTPKRPKSETPQIAVNDLSALSAHDIRPDLLKSRCGQRCIGIL